MTDYKHGSKLVFWVNEKFQITDQLDLENIKQRDYRIDASGQISCFLNDSSLSDAKQKLDFIAAHLMVTLPSFSKGIILIPYTLDGLKDSGFDIKPENVVSQLDIHHCEIIGVNEGNCKNLISLGYSNLITEKIHNLYDIESLWDILKGNPQLFREYFSVYSNKKSIAMSALKGYKKDPEFRQIFTEELN